MVVSGKRAARHPWGRFEKLRSGARASALLLAGFSNAEGISGSEPMINMRFQTRTQSRLEDEAS
jgi:hypothetical protein